MSAVDPIAAIEGARLLTIIRMDDPEDVLVEALLEAGVEVVELSLVSRGSLAAIERWRSRFPQLVLGAGTVLDESACERAIDAGAAFLISPGFEPTVSARARAAGVPYIPGALTPTEIRTCLADGAALVKLFPATPLGPGYVRQLLGPFPTLRLLPTGGVDESNATAFLGAGAAAVAVGSSIVGPGSTYESVRRAAAQLVGAIAPIKKGESRHAG
jgi:2-dehydro-3-deoxyphosphogluconate aldolase / (4S)-4-hydroxy-2-oxoglutarate aldolase